MPKKQTPQDTLDRLGWLNNLTETQWSRGLLDTAIDLKAEIERLESQKAEVEEEIKKRTRVLRMLPSRAEREAALIYPQDVVEKAKP